MPDPTTCPTCGNPLQDGAKFCGSCGNATAPNPMVPPAAQPPTGDEPAAATPADPPAPAGEPTVAAQTPDDPWAPGEEDGPEEEPPLVAPSAAPPPGGWGAPTPGVGPAVPPTAVGGAGIIGGAYGATTAQPATGGASPQPTMAEQAVAAAGESLPPGEYGGGPSGEGPGGGEGDVPHWMPDPSKEQESSRSGILVVLGVAAGVLITLILLAIVLVVNGGDDDDDVSSDDTTTTTEAETTTTTERQTTTSTTEAETTTSTTEAPTTTTTAAPNPPALVVGDCISNDPTADDFSLTGPGADVDVVPCSQGHLGELYYTEQVPDGSYPDSSDFSEICVGMPFQAYVGTPYQQSAVWATAVFPTEDEWDDGDRLLWCVAHENPVEQVTGSYRNSSR